MAAGQVDGARSSRTARPAGARGRGCGGRSREELWLEQDPDRLHVQSFSALFLISGAACVAALAIHACVLARQYSRHVAAEQAALPGGGAGGDGAAISRSGRRSGLRAFLSFADRREPQLQRGAKDPAALGASGSSSGVSSFTSSNASMSSR